MRRARRQQSRAQFTQTGAAPRGEREIRIAELTRIIPAGRVARASVRLLLVEFWLSFIYASYNGGMVVHLTEIVPVAVRTAGFSLAYSPATTIGGATPSLCVVYIAGPIAADGK